MFIKNALALSISLGLSVSLIGCSGGSPNPSSDSSSGDGTDNTTTTVASVSGTAAKGLVTSGTVIAYNVNDDGSTGTEIGRATTDANGVFTVSINSNYQTGHAILFEIVDGQMVCDALAGCGSVSYGQSLVLPTGFAMKSIIAPVNQNDSVKGQITPFTHMAAAAVVSDLKNGESHKVAVSNGNTQINAMLGFDCQNVSPADITKSTTVKGDSIKYALWLGAFADLIFNNGGDINVILSAWADEFADGKFDGGNANVNLRSLLSALKNQLKDERNQGLDEDARDSVDANETKLDGLVGDDGSYDPEPEDKDTVDLTNVDRAKNMISNTRTWLVSFNQLQTPADALSSDVTAIADTLNGNTNTVISAGITVMYRAVETLIDSELKGHATPTQFKVTDEDGNLLSYPYLNVTSASGEKLVFTIDASYIGDNSINAQFTVSLDQTPAEIAQLAKNGGNITGTLTAASVADSAVAASLDGMQFDIVLKKTHTPAIAKTITVSGPATLTLVANHDVITTSSAKIELATLSEGLADSWDVLPPTVVTNIELPNMQRTNGDGNKLSATLDMGSSAKLVDPISLRKGNAAVWVNEHISDSDVLGFSHDSLATLYTANYMHSGVPWLADKAEVAYLGADASGAVNTFSGSLSDTQKAAVAQMFSSLYNSTESSYIASTDKWRLSYSSANSPYGDTVGTNVVGMLRLNSLADLVHFVDAKLKISTTLSLTGAPTAQVGMILNTDLTAVDENSLSFSLNYNKRDLNVTINTVSDTTATAIIDNAQGVILTLNYVKDDNGMSVKDGTVVVKGNTVGTISETNGLTMIRYTDGSFETLE